MTKKTEKNVSPENEQEKISKKKRNGAYNKRRGNAYETKIAKELRDLGFNGVVTSRSESKRADDNKVDLVDTENKLPFFPQLKRTINTPQYFKIREESTVDPEKFVLFWNKQEPKETNICSVGECVILDKNFFYELIKPYAK